MWEEGLRSLNRLRFLSLPPISLLFFSHEDIADVFGAGFMENVVQNAHNFLQLSPPFNLKVLLEMPNCAPKIVQHFMKLIFKQRKSQYRTRGEKKRKSERGFGSALVEEKRLLSPSFLCRLK